MAIIDGLLRHGDKGDDVKSLQTSLATLGYTDKYGNTLKPDAHFGPATDHALKTFQRDHGLKDDGIAGKATQAAITESTLQAKAPSLLDAHHPAHGIYEQAYQCVSRLDAERGSQSGSHTQTFAGSLTAAATAAGFKQIDHVILNDDASRGWAVQGDLTSPFKKYTEVDVMKAIQTPLQQSSQEAAEHVQASAQHQQQAQSQQQSMHHNTMQQLIQQGASLSR